MVGHYLVVVLPMHNLLHNLPNRQPRPLHHHNPRRQLVGEGEIAAGAQGHAANESVPIAGMVEAVEIQMDVVKRLLG